MKWFVVVLCLLGYGEGVALRCTAGSKESSCIEQEKEPPISIAQGNVVEVECLAGSKWESNCHLCRCSDQGIAFCERRESCDKEFDDPIRCKPETMFARDCNTCTCLENGVVLCTQAHCANSDSYLTSKKSQMASGKECAPGSYWKSKCNDCGCSPQGYSFCTERACIGEENDTVMRCAPDTVWNNDCNTCWCTANGNPLCTKMGCVTDRIEEPVSEVKKNKTNLGVDHIERHSVCKPRGTFYIGCNTCHCNFYGTDYSCTNKPCPLPEDVELFHELKETKTSKNKTQKIVCVANRMFIKDCNTCWCNEDGTSFVCTRRVCVSDLPGEDGGEEKPEALRIIKRECRPDEVFELDCNMCRCNPDGKSFSCTRRACVETPEEANKNISLSRITRDVAKNDPPKNCLPNQEFRMDCNKCLCDPTGQDFSCTRTDCFQLNNNNNNGNTRARREISDEPTTPTTISSTPVSQHETCSGKDCPGESKNETAVATQTESDPNFRCNPGEQFKRGCNDCSCSADGKSFFCTVKFCDQDITPPSTR